MDIIGERRRPAVATHDRWATLGGDAAARAEAILEALALRRPRDVEVVAAIAGVDPGTTSAELEKLAEEGLAQHDAQGWTFTDAGLGYACRRARTRQFSGTEYSISDAIAFNAEFERTH